MDIASGRAALHNSPLTQRYARTADMHNDIRISLVIATYNWPEALRACVEGCFRQSDRNFEIIVADDGSGAPTRALVEELCARSPVPMRHVWQPDDGFRLAESRNNGILAASGDYIVTLDGDCVPQSDFIARHRALAEPGYMVTGSRILLNQAFSERVLREGIDLQSLSLGEKLRYRLQSGLGNIQLGTCHRQFFFGQDHGEFRFDQRHLRQNVLCNQTSRLIPIVSGRRQFRLC